MIKKIWHISDTHNYHDLLIIPDSIDIVIHSGDFTTNRDIYRNEPEMNAFITWYGQLNIPTKVLIAGNHDFYAGRFPDEFKRLCEANNIIYLLDELLEIDGIKMYGSPYTPSFGDWYFQKSRSKMDEIWKRIPSETEILIVHGPPKGVLDLSYNKNHELEMAGDRALKNNILRVNPKLCLFGHIHSNNDVINAGVLKLANTTTTFSNGSVVTDGKFGTLSSLGNILEFEIIIPEEPPIENIP